MGKKNQLGLHDKLAEEYEKGVSRKSIIKTSPFILPGEVKQLTGGVDFDRVAEEIGGEVNIFSGDIPYQLGEAQGAWDKVANFGVQLGAEIFGGILEGVGYLGDWQGLHGMYHKDLSTWGNWLSNLGTSMKEGSRESFPIFGAQDEGSLGWWLSNGVSVGSTLSLMIPAIGATRGIGMLGKAMGLVAKGVRGERIYKGLSVLGQAFISRHMENMMESHQIWEGTRDEAFQRGTGYDEANYLASKAASRTYMKNYNLILQDIFQYAIGSGVFGKIGSTNPKLAGMANQKVMLNKGALAAMYGFDMLTEGAEEAYQYIVGEESRYHALADAGLIPQEERGDRYNKYMKSSEMWTSALFGAIGAGVMQAGRAGLKRTNLPLVGGKEEREREQEQIRVAEEAFNKMTAAGIKINNALINKNEKQALEVEEENAFNIAYTHAENGTEQIGQASIDNLIDAIDNATEEQKQEFAPNYRERLLRIKKTMAEVSKDYKRNKRKYQPSTVRPITLLQYQNKGYNKSLIELKDNLAKEKQELPRVNELSARGQAKFDALLDVASLDAAIKIIEESIKIADMPEHIADLEARKAKLESKRKEVQNKFDAAEKEEKSFKKNSPEAVAASTDNEVLVGMVENAGAAAAYGANIVAITELLNANNRALKRLTSKEGQKARREMEEAFKKAQQEAEDAAAAEAANEYQEEQEKEDTDSVNNSVNNNEGTGETEKETTEETEEEKPGPTGEEVGREPEPDPEIEKLKQERDEKIKSLEEERARILKEIEDLENTKDNATEFQKGIRRLLNQDLSRKSKRLIQMFSEMVAPFEHIQQNVKRITGEVIKLDEEHIKFDKAFYDYKSKNIEEQEQLLQERIASYGIELEKAYTPEELEEILEKMGLGKKGGISEFSEGFSIVKPKHTRKVFDATKKSAQKLGVTVRFSTDGSLFDARKSAGWFRLSENVIYVDARAFKFNTEKVAQTVVHELVHGMSSYVIETVERAQRSGVANDAYNSLTKKQIQAVKNLQAILEELKQDEAFKDFYGITNTHELIAELTNPRFVAALKKKKINEQSLLDKIVSAIAEFLGLDTSAYDIVYEALETFAETTNKETLNLIAPNLQKQEIRKSEDRLSELKRRLAQIDAEIKKVSREYSTKIKAIEAKVEEAPVETTDTTTDLEAERQKELEALPFGEVAKGVLEKAKTEGKDRYIRELKNQAAKVKGGNDILERHKAEDALKNSDDIATRVTARLNIKQNYPFNPTSIADVRGVIFEKIEVKEKRVLLGVEEDIKEAYDAELATLKAKTTTVEEESVQETKEEQSELAALFAEGQKRNEEEENVVNQAKVKASALSDDVPVPPNEIELATEKGSDPVNYIAETGYALAWASANLAEKRKYRDDKSYKEALALSKFFEDPNIDVTEYGAVLSMDVETLNDWAKYKKGTIQRTIADKIKANETLTEEEVGMVPISGKVINKEGGVVSVDGVKLRINLHNTNFRWWSALSEEKRNAAIAETIKIKFDVLTALNGNKQAYIKFDDQRPGTLQKDPITEANLKNVATTLNIEPANITFVSGGKAAPGQKTGTYIDSNKRKVDELENTTATPGAIYALVKTGNGMPFPLRMFTQDLIEEEIDLIYEIYSKTLQNPDTYNESLNKHPSLLTSIRTSRDKRVSELVDLVDPEVTTLQDLLAMLVFEGSITKELGGGRLFSTPKLVVAGNTKIDKNRFLTEDGKEIFRRALATKRRQINVGRLSDPVYKNYIVNNNLVRTTVKEGLQTNRDGQSNLFKQPTVIFNDVEVTESTTTSFNFKTKSEEVTKEEVIETKEATTDTITDVEAKKADIEKRTQEKLAIHQEELKKALEEANKLSDELPTKPMALKLNKGKSDRQVAIEVAEGAYEFISNKINEEANAEIAALETTDTTTTTKSPVTKIISGGQTGVDSIGLVVGKELGIETGGTAPKGFKIEGGKTAPFLKDFGLTESTSSDYNVRTEENVKNSDGTVYFAADTKSAGLKSTKRFAEKHNKPFLLNPTAKELSEWMTKNNIKTLNIAGNRKSKLKEQQRKNIGNIIREALGGTVESTITAEEVIPGVEIKRNALSKEEQLELFDLIKKAIEEQGAKTNKGKNANIMAGLGLRWDQKSNNVGREPIKIDNIITPASAARYGYYEVSINGQELGEITPRIKELMTKATGIDATNYDGAIINLYTEDTFISNHQDVDEAASAIKYPVLVANIGGNGNFVAQNKQNTLEAGDAYVFGLDGKNRKVYHRTFASGIDGFLPAITTKIDGKTYPAGSYRISVTLRRVKNLEEGMPTAPAKANEVTAEEVDTSSTESIIETSRDVTEPYPQREDFDIELGKKLQAIFEKLYPEIQLIITENPKWQVASDSVLNQEVLDFVSTNEIEEMKAKEFYERLITRFTTPTKFSKKSIKKIIGSVIGGRSVLSKIKLNEEEIKHLEAHNKYRKKSAGLKSFKILAKKYKKQRIALSAPIKLDGVKGPELNILNSVRESIKLDNPKVKSVTAEEFIKEVQVFLDANYVLGFALENTWLNYRVGQTFNRPAGVKHRKISLRYNDEFFNASSHYPLSPSAFGTITYYNADPISAEETVEPYEELEEIFPLEDYTTPEHTSSAAPANAVLLHEIQNDFFRKLRKELKAEKKAELAQDPFTEAPAAVSDDQILALIENIKKYPVFLMNAFRDVLDDRRAFNEEDAYKRRVRAYRERVEERINLLSSDRYYRIRESEKSKVEKENIKRFLSHLKDLQQSGKLNEIVDKHLPEGLTKDIRVSQEVNENIISDLLQGFNVVLDNYDNLTELQLDKLIPGELLNESRETKLKYLEQNPQSQISVDTFLRKGVAYQIQRGSSLEQDRRDLKTGRMPARLFAKSRKQFAAALAAKLRKVSYGIINQAESSILNNIIRDKNIESNRRYATLTDEEIQATFDKLFVEYNNVKEIVKNEKERKASKVKSMLSDKNNIEHTYANVLLHNLIQAIIKEGKGFPIYFTGFGGNMSTQGSRRSAVLYAGPEDVKKGLAEKEGVLHLALKKIPGIKLHYVEDIPGLKRDGNIPASGYRVDVSNYNETAPLLYQRDAVGKIIGQANIEALTVLIDAANQKQDTLPHEYAHHYIRTWRNTAIVQEGIKRFGSEEALVEAIGKQAVEFVKTGKEGEALSWWRKFTKWILSKLTNQEVLDALTYAVLSRKDLTSFNEKVIQAEEAERAEKAKQKKDTASAQEKFRTDTLNIELKGINQRKKTIEGELEELKAEKHEKTLESYLEDEVSEEEYNRIMAEEGLNSKEEAKEAIKEEVVSQMNNKSKLPAKPSLLQRIASAIKNMFIGFLITATMLSTSSFSLRTEEVKTYGYDNLIVNDLQSFTSVKFSQDELNKLDNVTKITKFNENTTTPYAIIDKSVGMAHFYKDGEFVTSYQVGTGEVEGDQQTTLKSAYFNSSGVEVSFEKATYLENGTRFLKDDYTSKTNWSQGNKQTGAGIYKIDRKGEYGGGDALFLKNEAGISVPSILHRVPNSVVRKRKLNDKDSTNNRFSNGCLNFNAADIEALIDSGLGAKSNVYVLPDNPNNKFEIIDNKLVFTSKDSLVNRSVYSFEAQPITIKANNLSQFHEFPETQQAIKGYVQTIANHKSDLMQLYPTISNEIYNEIATLAYGILGQESSFGTYGGLRGQEGLVRDYAQIKINQLTGKETRTPSVGITQARIFSVPKKVRKKFNINKSEDLFGLYNSRNSALATMGILLDIYVYQTPSTRKNDFKTILPLLYSNQRKTAARVFKGEKITNTYVTNVLKYAQEVDVYLGTKEINNLQENAPLSPKDTGKLSMAGMLFLFRRKRKETTTIEEIDEETKRLENEYKLLTQRERYIKARLGVELEITRVQMEPIPASALAILDKMRADSKVVVLENENDDFYVHKNIPGKTTKYLQLLRVSKVITPEVNQTDIMQAGAALGRKVDRVVRDFFNEKLKSHTHYKLASKEEFEGFVEQLKALRYRFEANNEHVVSDEITLHNIEMGIAGTTDIITVDNKGVWRIYDMKGQRGNRLKDVYKSDPGTPKYDSTLRGKIKSERQKHKEQLSMYRILMYKTYGVLAKNIEIIPIELQYGENDTTTKTLDLKASIEHTPENNVLGYSITTTSPSGKENVDVTETKIIHKSKEELNPDGSPAQTLSSLLSKISTESPSNESDQALDTLEGLRKRKKKKNNNKGKTKIREAEDNSTPITAEEIKRVEEIVPEDMKVEVVKDYLRLLSGGRRVVGLFTDSMIKISTLAKTGDAFHEAFHGIFKTALTETEQRELIEEAKSLFLGPLEEEIEDLQNIHNITRESAIDLFYEEQLADEFSLFMANPKTYKGIKSKSKHEGLFKRLLTWLKEIIQRPKNYKTLFRKIQQGEFNKARSVDLMIQSGAIEQVNNITKKRC